MNLSLVNPQQTSLYITVHPQVFRSSFTQSFMHFVPFSLLILYQNIFVPLRPGSEVTSVNLLCPCPKTNRTTRSFLCGPTATFYTCVIALDSVFTVGMGVCDSVVEYEFYQKSDLVLLI